MRHVTTVPFLVAALLFSMAPAGAVAPTFNGNTITPTTPAVNASWYGVKCNGSADDTTAAQNAINAAGQLSASKTAVYVLFPGGTCQYSSTLTNANPNVIIKGQGGDEGHDVGANCTSSTIFKWIGGSSSSILQVAPTAGASGQNLYGAGVENICFTSNTTNKATHALYVLSTSDATFENLFADDTFSSSKFYFGAQSTLGERTDSQHNLILNLACQGKDDSADCLYLDGGGSPVGNFSMNTIINMFAGYHNGNGITCNNADNNLILNYQGYNYSSGTGQSVDLKSSCLSNTFMRFTPGGAWLAETGSNGNSVINLDEASNSSVAPTIQSGAHLYYTYDTGEQFNSKYINAAVGSTPYEAGLALSHRASTTSMYIVNGSQDELRLDDGGGTNVWGMNIDGSGNLRFSKFGGSGTVTFPTQISASSFVTGSTSVNATSVAVNGNTTTQAVEFGTTGGSLRGDQPGIANDGSGSNGFNIVVPSTSAQGFRFFTCTGTTSCGFSNIGQFTTSGLWVDNSGYKTGSSQLSPTSLVVNGHLQQNSTCEYACKVTLAAGTATWTFGTAFNNIPVCSATPEGTPPASALIYETVSTSSVVITSTVNTDTRVVDIICTGYPN